MTNINLSSGSIAPIWARKESKLDPPNSLFRVLFCSVIKNFNAPEERGIKFLKIINVPSQLKQIDFLTICLALLFFLLSLFGVINHEIWLDESHHWLLARDSTSLSDLIKNTRYEGHPIPWNILLYFLSR